MNSTNVTVVDSMMGSGKSSWAIQYINDNKDKNFLYITPYISEIERVRKATDYRMNEPKFTKGGRKLDNLKTLLESQCDIASTHALFLMLDDDCMKLIASNHYILILDEAINPVSLFEDVAKDDVEYLLDKKSIEIQDNSMIKWIDDKFYDNKYATMRRIADNDSLFYVNKTKLLWRYPPQMFSIFNHVYVLTYLFNGSLMKYYFDLCKIEYDLASTKKDGEKYSLIPHEHQDVSKYSELINIYDGKLNDIFEQKRNSTLSKSWFTNPNNKDKIEQVKKAMYNYLHNVAKGKSGDSMWTTFKSAKCKFIRKGYDKSFVPCNARATNDYANRFNLAYLLNVFPNTIIEQFFLKFNIEVSRESVAIAELLQWIWRSRVRNELPINVYIPSVRMRELLVSWYDTGEI